MFGDNFVHNCTRHFRTLFVHFANCEMSILSNDAAHLLLQCVCDDRGSPWSLSVMNIRSPIQKHCAPFRHWPVHNMFAIDCKKSSVNFTGSNVFHLQITPRTSQSAGFDIGAFIVTGSFTHNVKKFAAPTAPGNYLHSTEHTKWLIWCNETTARVVCANVLYFPNSPRTYCMDRPKYFNVKVDGTYSYHCSIMVKRTYFYQNNEYSREGVRSPEVAVCIFIVTTTFLNWCNLDFMQKQWT